MQIKADAAGLQAIKALIDIVLKTGGLQYINDVNLLLSSIMPFEAENFKEGEKTNGG